MKLFGFELKRSEKNYPTFVSKVDEDDGATIVAPGGAYGIYVDIDGTIRSEAELVTRYRDMTMYPDIDIAVEEIVNEAINIEDENPISIVLDDINISEQLKQIIISEFTNTLKILNFNKYAYDIFRKWYVDGRLYYHVVIDPNDPTSGIQELRYIDPRKIKKIREVSSKDREPAFGNENTVVLPKTVNEYFVYNDKGFNINTKYNTGATTGLKIAKDSIIFVPSGLSDTNGTMVLSYLHKALRVLNQLRMLEDAIVIYRLSRAPERRVWYVDVGNLPKVKAEQYVRDLMIRHKNRLVYDSSTGEVRDDRKFATLLEDYWLPRREGSRGTEVTTLPAGQSLNNMDDLLYFQRKMFSALNVPLTRLNPETSTFTLGRASEITRDEIKFYRFIVRLRTKFSQLFLQILEKQLVLKNIMTADEWNEISNGIKFRFAKDNYYNELKNSEILQNRIMTYTNLSASGVIGKYYSDCWVRKNVFMQSEQDILEQDEKIAQEAQMNAQMNNTTDEDNSNINNDNDANNAVDEILNNDELDDNIKLQQLISLKDSLSKMNTNSNINRNLLIRINRNIQVLQQKLQQKAVTEE